MVLKKPKCGGKKIKIKLAHNGGGFAKAFAFAKPFVGGQSRRAFSTANPPPLEGKPALWPRVRAKGFPSNLLIHATNVGQLWIN